MDKNQITDVAKAQAAIAFLISEGWQIDLHALKCELPGGITNGDWLGIANGCLDYCMNAMAAEKVIPITRFRRS